MTSSQNNTGSHANSEALRVNIYGACLCVLDAKGSNILCIKKKKCPNEFYYLFYPNLHVIFFRKKKKT